MFGFANALPWLVRKAAAKVVELIGNLTTEDGEVLLTEDGEDLEVES